MLCFEAHGVTVRYALIIGNNDGKDSDGTRPFSPLMHAEREAKVLKNKLIQLANFDPSGQRTKILLGTNRSAIKSAVQKLVERQQADKKAFGEIETLFLFYYTGHGLDGRLLLDDGALLSHEIGDIFQQIDADFSIGIFDACFSGSLDTTLLASKGIHSAPGLNLFRELPEEVLAAEGSIWYVSSGSHQESFEDKRLGGVFTHFFIEGLEKGEPTGPGVTLENVWQYARSHTVEYTAARKKMQVPEQYIANLRTNAPIYFSFLKPRSATLVLTEGVSGRFALAYRAGNFTELFEKSAGSPRSFAVYPGTARLLLVDKQDNVVQQPIVLNHGEKLVLGSLNDPSPSLAVGERFEPLFEKGIAIDTQVFAKRIRPGPSLLIGVGYDFNLAHAHLLFARHGASIPFRVDRGPLFVNASLNYAYDKRHYPAWTHTVHKAGGRVGIGLAKNLAGARLGAGIALDAGYLHQRFSEAKQRSGVQLRPLFQLNLLYQVHSRVNLALSADVGGMYTPGIGVTAEYLWRVSATMGAAVYFRAL